MLETTDPLWLRLWAVRYQHHRPDLLALISDEERQTYELGADPWPHPSREVTQPARLERKNVPAGTWTSSSPSSSAGTVAYLDDTRVLRVATTRHGQRCLKREQRFTEQVISRHVPPVTGAGPGWLMTTRLVGTSPTLPGPWLRDLCKFLHDLHTLDAPVRSRGRRPRLRALARVTDLRSARELNALRCDALTYTDNKALVPTHGELCAANLLVHDNARLIGVTCYEHVALAPVERDIASLLTQLTSVTGSRALGQAVGETFEPLVLASELIDQLETSARLALTNTPGEANASRPSVTWPGRSSRTRRPPRDSCLCADTTRWLRTQSGLRVRSISPRSACDTIFSSATL